MPTTSSNVILNEGPIHVIDQTINEIAAEFRFTVGEVKEFYDKVSCVHFRF